MTATVTSDLRKPTRDSTRFHVPALDGLRFFAFLLVWFHHCGSDPDGIINTFIKGGWAGVDLFLVLSSYLITALLILEHDKTGTISVSSFYSRRVLRIWPLFFLALILNYLVLPLVSGVGFQDPIWRSDMKRHFLPLFLLLGNWSVAVFSYSSFGFVAHLWTICLEEQFYLFWPLVAAQTLGRRYWLASLCLALFVFSLIARWYFHKVNFPFPASWVSTLTRLDPFAWGALTAIAEHGWRRRLGALRERRWTNFAAAAALVTILVLLFSLLSTWNWYSTGVWWKLTLIDVLMGALLVSVLSSKTVSKIFSFRLFTWLGKISYGLYVWHFFFRSEQFLSRIKTVVGINDLNAMSTLQYWMLMSLAFTMLVVTSAISYYGYESFFLRWKARYAIIPSRPD